jgi:hypothetical protein
MRIEPAFETLFEFRLYKRACSPSSFPGGGCKTTHPPLFEYPLPARGRRNSMAPQTAPRIARDVASSGQTPPQPPLSSLLEGHEGALRLLDRVLAFPFAPLFYTLIAVLCLAVAGGLYCLCLALVGKRVGEGRWLRRRKRMEVRMTLSDEKIQVKKPAEARLRVLGGEDVAYTESGA